MKCIFLISIVFLFPLDSLKAQASDEIIVQGKIINASTGKAVKAKVKYKSIPTGGIYGSFNDSTFAFSMFGSAKYQVTAEASGFIPRSVIVDPNEAIDKTITRDIPLSPKGQTIRLSNLIFAQGKAVIDPKSFNELDEVAALMQDNANMVIQLEGHTDNVGSSSGNLKLSQARVDAVKKYLVEKEISKNRIKTKAFGGSQPLANEMTPEARALNRRVEMRILKD